MDAYLAAKQIVEKLTEAGYVAYFAGGWVRDYLMEHPSDDIDIATDAPPEKILDLFPRTILVGLAFGVVIVVSQGHQFEVATFRRDVDYKDGRKPSQIELATPEEDASRRDFTINGMFYDPIEGVVHDFVHGAEDIKNHVIRAIGDPYQRFTEDRLRMIRAIRFASRFAFTIDPDTEDAIRANVDNLFPSVAIERVWQEFNKMSKYPRFDAAIIEMHRLDLLPVVFPSLKGTHLNDIKKRILHFPNCPKNTPTILYLLALFPTIAADEVEDLGRYLRVSTSTIQLAQHFIRIQRHLSDNESNPMIWTHLYANPHTSCCLETIAAALSETEKLAFLAKHQQQQQLLQPHVDRIINKTPLINAEFLKTYRIIPGKLMGSLLKEAERLAITCDLHDPLDVMKHLQQTELWPYP